MKTFAVYTKPIHDLEGDGVYYLKEGFSILAFLFSGLWLIYHRLWKEIVIFFFLNTIVYQLHYANVLNQGGLLISLLALQIAVGFIGRDLIRLKLLRTGYKLSDIVIANTFDEAEYKYIERSLNKHGKHTVVES